jgi:hypothetical protein
MSHMRRFHQGEMQETMDLVIDDQLLDFGNSEVFRGMVRKLNPNWKVPHSRSSKIKMGFVTLMIHGIPKAMDEERSTLRLWKQRSFVLDLFPVEEE